MIFSFLFRLLMLNIVVVLRLICLEFEAHNGVLTVSATELYKMFVNTTPKLFCSKMSLNFVFYSKMSLCDLVICSTRFLKAYWQFYPLLLFLFLFVNPSLKSSQIEIPLMKQPNGVYPLHFRISTSQNERKAATLMMIEGGFTGN